MITFCLAVLITIPLTLHDYRKLEKQKQTGTKTIVQGIVTRKYSDDDDSSPSYYIEIDKLSIMVEQNLYSKYEVGDGIEIHIYKPRFNMVLFDRKIESAW